MQKGDIFCSKISLRYLKKHKGLIQNLKRFDRGHILQRQLNSLSHKVTFRASTEEVVRCYHSVLEEMLQYHPPLPLTNGPQCLISSFIYSSLEPLLPRI